jgi:hypothetical protein
MVVVAKTTKPKEVTDKKKYREAFFYALIMPSLRSEFPAPECLVSIADPESGRSLVVSRFLDDHRMLSDLFFH